MCALAAVCRRKPANFGNANKQGNTSDGRSGVSHFPELSVYEIAYEAREDSALDGLQHTRWILEERCVESSRRSLGTQQESRDSGTSEAAELAHQTCSPRASACEVAHKVKVDCKVQERRREIEERNAERLHRCLVLLKEMEKSGVLTALDLAHQRAKLRRTEGHHEVIHVTLQQTKKDLRCWWSKAKHSVVDHCKKFRLPKQPTSTEDKDTVGNATGWFKRTMSIRRSKKRTLPQQPSPVESVVFAGSDSHLGLQLPVTSRPATPNRTKTILEHKLDDMVTSLTFLRGLAKDLRQELDYQDKVLSRLSDKTEDTVTGISSIITS